MPCSRGVCAIPACIAGGIPACLAAGVCAIPACLAVGGACSQGGGLLPGGGLLWGVPGPGGSAPGGCLVQGSLLLGGVCSKGGAWWRPPGRPPLQAVRFLLECILVRDIVAICEQFIFLRKMLMSLSVLNIMRKLFKSLCTQITINLHQ